MLFSFTNILLDQILTLLLSNIRNHYPPCMDVCVCTCVLIDKQTGSGVQLPLIFLSIIIPETLTDHFQNARYCAKGLTCTLVQSSSVP